MIRRATVTLSALLTGCAVVCTTGPVSTRERLGSERDVAARVVELGEVGTSIGSSHGRAALEVEALGRFAVSREKTVFVEEGQTGRTAFGFFPWGKAEDRGAYGYFYAVFENVQLLFLPTLYACFIEPFSDYPGNGSSDHSFASWSLFGCYRYCAELTVRRQYERMETNQLVQARHRVDEFSVNYEGTTFRSASGRIVLPVPYEPTMTLQARLVSIGLPMDGLRERLESECLGTYVWRAQDAHAAGVPLNLSEETLVGRWEAFQAYRTQMRAGGSGRSVEENTIWHRILEFSGDGNFRFESDRAGQSPVTSIGRWRMDGKLLRIESASADGGGNVEFYRIRQLDRGLLELRHVDLRAYDRSLLRGNVKTVRSRYDGNGDLETSFVLVDVSAGRSRVEKTVAVSPFIVERVR